MKHISFITCTLLTIALITSGCTKNVDNQNKTQNIAKEDNQNNPQDTTTTLQSDEVPGFDFQNRKPFKYTITTDVEEMKNNEWFDREEKNNDFYNMPDGNVVISIQINTVDGKLSTKYDLDCEGDGDYEFKGLTDNHKCVYELNSGRHQIWIRGDIPAMWLCKGIKTEEERLKDTDTDYYDYWRYREIAEEIALCEEWYKDKKLLCVPSYLSFIHKNHNNSVAVVSVDDWGDTAFQSMFGFAADCINLKQIPEESPNLEHVTDMSGMFWGAWSFNQPLDKWNVSNVTDMSGMFKATGSFNQPLDNWDVSNVTDMHGMFSSAISFNQPLEKWNVSKVTDMSLMFDTAWSFNQPLNKWNVSKVTDMSLMFQDARSFNHYPESWSVPKDDLEHMFAGTKVEKLADKKPLKTR